MDGSVSEDNYIDETLIPLEQFLEHYGIKGMRWGVRKTGSPSVGSGKKTKANTRYKEKASTLSVDELGARIKRLEMERRYTDLNSPTRTKGKKFIGRQMENLGSQLVVAVAGTAITLIVKDAVEKRIRG